MTRTGANVGINAPAISIITIVRNDREGLDRTCQSVRSQTCRDFEWLVVDGASTDDTRHLVDTVLASGEARGLSEPDAGIYDAMNKGLALARGRYVLFLNAGDRLIDTSALATVVTRIRDAGEPDVAFFASTMAFGARMIRRDAKPPSYIWHGQPALHQATFVRRTVHLDHRFSTQYRICGDYDVLARLAMSGARMESFSDLIGVNEFQSDATSGRNKMRLIREAVTIQRRVLHLPIWKCAVSVSRRTVNSAVFKILTKFNERRTP